MKVLSAENKLELAKFNLKTFQFNITAIKIISIESRHLPLNMNNETHISATKLMMTRT